MCYVHAVANPLTWRSFIGRIGGLRIGSLLDVGTGDGAFPLWVHRRFPNADPLMGIDVVSPNGNQRTGRPDDVRVHDATDLPFKSKVFDWVTAFNLLEDLLPDEVDPVLKDFERVAVKGMVLLVDPEKVQPDVSSFGRVEKSGGFYIVRF